MFEPQKKKQCQKAPKKKKWRKRGDSKEMEKQADRTRESTRVAKQIENEDNKKETG